MKNLLHRLWSDQSGAILSAEIMLVASILVIGVLVGLSALRDSVVTELADFAQAIANIDQSYSFSGVLGHHAYSGGGMFADRIDFCDRCDVWDDRGNSKCVLICTSGMGGGEGSMGGGGGGGHGGY